MPAGERRLARRFLLSVTCQTAAAVYGSSEMASDETQSGPDPLGAARDAAEAAGERLGNARAGASERIGAARDAAGKQMASARETAAMAAQAAAQKLAQKPRLRGVSHQWAFFVSLGAGRGPGPRGEWIAGGDRDVDLRLLALGDARHQRPLPPRHLDPGGAPVDAPARPHDDLHLHRRHLHALRTARHARDPGQPRADRGLGHRRRRAGPQSRLDQLAVLVHAWRST